MPVSNLAYSGLVGTQTTFDLFVGNAQVLTNHSVSLVAAAAKHEVVALTDTGITTFVPGTHVAAQAVILTEPVTAVGQAATYYTAGGFNHAALVWPAGTALDTYAERKKFFTGTPIQIGKLAVGGTSAS